MKLGLISDVHGDPVALELAWAHLTVLGAERVLCAGDLVGYGPFPDRVVEFFRRHEIPSVRGNHDRWAAERPPWKRDQYGGGTPTRETVKYLRTLPPNHVLDLAGKVAVIVHGSPSSDLEFIKPRTHPPDVLSYYLNFLDTDLFIFGHTHEPAWFRCERGLAVNPGSLVSTPVTHTSRTFALVDTETLGVTFHDVESGEDVSVDPWGG